MSLRYHDRTSRFLHNSLDSRKLQEFRLSQVHTPNKKLCRINKKQSNVFGGFMNIRKFKPEDSKKVSKIMIEAFKSFLGDKFDKLNSKSFSPEILRKVSNSKSYDGEVVSYVAEEKGEILGYIRGTAHINGLGGLEVVGVDTVSFHKGVGARLMKELEKFWIRKKQRKVSTCVSAHNKRALIYYIKNGFVPEGYRRDHFKVGVDEVILGRFLNGNVKNNKPQVNTDEHRKFSL